MIPLKMFVIKIIHLPNQFDHLRGLWVAGAYHVYCVRAEYILNRLPFVQGAHNWGAIKNPQLTYEALYGQDLN